MTEKLPEASPNVSPNDTPTAAQVAEELEYAASTGRFRWRVRRRGRMRGWFAGTQNHHGYVMITVLGRQYAAHRLAWAIVTGAWPALQIDHINGDKADNRFCNLREADASQNKANTGPQRNSTSGLRGVSWCAKDRRWHARIKVGPKRHFLGGFKSKEEAAEAYAAAAQEHFGEFASTARRSA